MNFKDELKRRFELIEHNLARHNIPLVRYDLVVRDMVGKVIKEIAWGLSLKECTTLAKHFEKSELIKDSEGQYSLHYLKVEKGLYRAKPIS